MNAFPPPTTPPVEPAGSAARPPRRRGLIAGAVIGAGALLAGGIVVGVALAEDGADPAPATATPAAQTEGGGLDAVLEAVEPFLTCIGENLELDGVEVPEDPTDLAIEDLPAVLDEAMAAGEAAFEACSDQLPADVPVIVPGPELLDELAAMDLADIPGLVDLWAELGAVFGLPGLDEAEARLDEAFEQLPSWEELEDHFEQHFEDFDPEALPRFEEMIEDFELDQLPRFEEMFEDFDPEALPRFEEMIEDFELDQLPRFEEMFEDFDPDALPDLQELFEEMFETFPHDDGG